MKSLVPVFFALAAGCVSLGAGAAPDPAVLATIQKNEKAANGQEAEAIYSYLYKGELTYLAVPSCCDHFQVLYTAQGKPICAPRGGFAGNGDGKCPDFEKEKKNETVVFKRAKKG